LTPEALATLEAFDTTGGGQLPKRGRPKVRKIADIEEANDNFNKEIGQEAAKCDEDLAKSMTFEEPHDLTNSSELKEFRILMNRKQNALMNIQKELGKLTRKIDKAPNDWNVAWW
jgi:hypothetical protein